MEHAAARGITKVRYRNSTSPHLVWCVDEEWIQDHRFVFGGQDLQCERSVESTQKTERLPRASGVFGSRSSSTVHSIKSLPNYNCLIDHALVSRPRRMQPRRADEKTLDLGVGVRPGIHQVYETLASRAQRACQVSAYVAAGVTLLCRLADNHKNGRVVGMLSREVVKDRRIE